MADKQLTVHRAALARGNPAGGRWKRITGKFIAERQADKERTPFIIAVWNWNFNGWTIGEAYWNAESNRGDGAWWWANTTDGEYLDEPATYNGRAHYYQQMPKEPECAEPPDES